MCRPGRNKNGTSCFSRGSPLSPPSPPLAICSRVFSLIRMHRMHPPTEMQHENNSRCEKVPVTVCMLAIRINAVENINLLILPVYLSVHRYSSYFGALDGLLRGISSFRFYSVRSKEPRLYKLPFLPISFRFLFFFFFMNEYYPTSHDRSYEISGK